MRKIQQAKIFELLQTLKEAHGEMRKQSASTDITGLLADCRNFAVHIGRYIEEIEGEGTQTVSLLEEYCEITYRASTDNSGANSVKKLRAQLIKIENAVRDELRPNSLEIVFLPYKYAMADSLQSIWEAAVADPQCDVYVCPIPYFDLLPDGVFGAMHCDGDLYPKTLPLVDWREYDIETRRPDIIYFHAPYDENNRVTSVHPDYYSKRLKNYTDLLVYSPYFVSYSDYINEHFVLTPGIMNASKVVVQSEEIRLSCIQAFNKFEREHNCKGKFGDPAKKFAALGSPKFDGAINTKREGISIPRSWQSLISGKKVILFNSSVGSILSWNKSYLKKLRDVLGVFKKRDDAVLLWRPHPLNETTYKSMMPQLLREYKQIVADYRREGYGIFDDGPDVHRAIAVSDAYYGDISSLVALYGVTGKPMMIQNRFIHSNFVQNTIMFSEFYDDGESFWFTAADFNALFRTDKQTRKTEFVGNISAEIGDGDNLFCLPVICEGKLYLAPTQARELTEYDIENRTIRKIPFDGLSGGSAWKFTDCISYKSDIFLMGCGYPAIAKYEINTGEFNYYDDWLKPAEQMRTGSQKAYFAYTQAVNNEIVAGTLYSDAAVIFNMDQCASNVIALGSRPSGYSDVCFDGGKYWFAPFMSGDGILSLNKETQERIVYSDFPEGFSFGTMSRICRTGKDIWLFPFDAGIPLKIDSRSGQSSVAEPFISQIAGLLDNAGYLFAKAIEDTVYTYAKQSNTLISYNTNTGERLEEQFTLSAKDRETCIDYCLSSHCDRRLLNLISDCAFKENTVFQLTDFLDRLIYGSSAIWNDIRDAQLAVCRDNIAHSDAAAGAAIHSEMKKSALG
ncbi:MAG: CDP-glycerol glycerophosphotransferase family protein [Clostridiales Family XIII bacterium]|jgi:hypothetical protein|nr:CDP-glycerol glycerophosphotransferase family protein [Clostridiales Family XIII bacterium]